MTLKLRNYQHEAVEKVLDEWAEGRSTLISMAVGTGKTEVSMTVLDRWLKLQHSGRALIVAHRIGLVEQPYQRMEKHFPDLFTDAGIVQGDKDRSTARVVVGTIQTLQSLDRFDRVVRNGKIDCLWIDEAHHAAAASYRDLIDRLKRHNPNLLVMGATATPRGGAGKYGLKQVFDTVAYKLPMNKAIEIGAIVPFKSVNVPVPADFSGVEIYQGDYDVKKAGTEMSMTPVIDTIIAAWKKHASDRQTIVFVYTVEQAEKLRHAFIMSGVRAQAVSYKDDPERREEVLEMFRVGKIRMLINVAVLGEGIDLPMASCMLQARPTTSDSVYVQQLGRVMRTHEGKTDALVLDCKPEGARDLFMAGDLLAGEPEWDARTKRLDWDNRNNKVWVAALSERGSVVAIAQKAEPGYKVFFAKTKAPRSVRLLGVAEGWSEVLAHVDALGEYQAWIASRNNKWKKKPEPASDGQRWLASNYGVRLKPDATTGEASKEITTAISIETVRNALGGDVPYDKDNQLVLDGPMDKRAIIRKQVEDAKRREYWARRGRPVRRSA